MRVPRTVQPLPRYVRRKWLKGQTWAYFFEPPTWARKGECPVAAEALGSDYATACDKAESILLPLFDSWRTGGLSDVVPEGALTGTFDWLVKTFKEHRTWSEIDRKTRRMYEQGFTLVADHVLKDGCRVGSKLLVAFTRGFVDALYAKLLVVEEKDSEGKTLFRERRRFANAAMAACRRAWFVGMRTQEKLVPPLNPFAKMGLKTRAVGQVARQTRRQRGRNSLHSEKRPRSSGTDQSAPPPSPPGNGYSVRSTCLERSSSSTTGQRNAQTARTSYILRQVRKHGGRSLTR